MFWWDVRIPYSKSFDPSLEDPVFLELKSVSGGSDMSQKGENDQRPEWHTVKAGMGESAVRFRSRGSKKAPG
jgi:hypothetical protein